MNDTGWIEPKNIKYAEEDEIEFKQLTTEDLVSATPAFSTALPYGDLLPRETNAVVFYNFDFPLISYTEILGIEVKLDISRLARIQDKTICLYQDKIISENKADLYAENVHIYGSPDDLWKTKPDVSFIDPSFGVLVDVQPHQQYPSSNLVYIRSLEIRLYYN